ncbi:ABC transporter substrate-binding protein [Humitalea sp. 24SJ18S-53]|uniref:ABC transporter substrate-binding protein n=1 Tax=Humitalea sp. 24SJ18S-53 TaxID=3422307 RepID=UPI003D664B8C
MADLVLQEPFRAIFYTPFYAALARGAFAAEGVEVRLITVGEPDRAVANLLSGAADLAWSGPMRVIRDHAADSDSPLVSFGAVVMGDPFFLVGAEPNPDFTLPDLLDLRLGTVSEVPTPWWCLGLDLREAGVDPAAIARTTDAGMAANLAAVLGGTLDVAQVFEPFATLAEQAGGSVWHAAATRGPTAYTAFYSTREKLAARAADMAGMVRGMARTLEWLGVASADAVAGAVGPFFPDIAPEVLSASILRYQALGIWATTPVFSRIAFNRLQESMLAAGAIATAPGFDACVDPAITADALG